MTIVVTEQARVTVTVSKKGDTGEQGESGLGTYGAKSSAVDAGVLGQAAYDDDYIYRCVVAGTAGNATWKRTILLTT